MHLVDRGRRVFAYPVMVSTDCGWSGMEAVFFCVLWFRGGSCFGWEGHGRGRRSADMRSGQSVKAHSMEPMSHCPAEPFCHFHFTLRTPKSGQLWYREGVRERMAGGQRGISQKKKKKNRTSKGERDRVREVWNKIAFLSNSAALKTRKLSVVGQKEGEKEEDGGKKEEGEMWPHRFTVMCAVTPG